MPTLNALLDTIGDHSKDLRINLQNVLSENSLSEPLRYAVALACARASRSSVLSDALAALCLEKGGAPYVNDALASASLMGMNNIFYRFRHMVHKDSYQKMHPRLRMQRLSKPETTKAEFELLSLAVSAINGCEVCVQAHEKTATDHGVTEENVVDAVRIAATVHGLAAALT